MKGTVEHEYCQDGKNETRFIHKRRRSTATVRFECHFTLVPGPREERNKKHHPGGRCCFCYLVTSSLISIAEESLAAAAKWQIHLGIFDLADVLPLLCRAFSRVLPAPNVNTPTKD